MGSIASDKLFEWKDYISWNKKLEAIYPSLLTSALIKKARKSKHSIESHFFTPFCSLSGLSEEEILTPVHQKLFRGNFPFLRVYHACRPINPEVYYEKGLLVNTPQRLFATFCEIFLGSNLPYLKKSHLQKIFESESSNPELIDNGELYVGLDDRHLIKFCGHYLIYGSETLHAWALKLPGGHNDYYRSILRSVGRPTMFCINLPNTKRYVPDFYIEELLKNVFSSWMYNTANSVTDNYKLSFTIKIKENLSPSKIHSHYFPEQIPDQHYHLKIYDSTTGKHI